MIYLAFLGGAGVRCETGLLHGPAFQRRRVAVLALMATSPGGRITRDKLMGYLWPEVDADSARHRLGDALYGLRKTLGRDAILTSGTEVYLNPAVIRSDVGEFTAALAGGDREGAVVVYAGPFLDGFFVRGACEFEHWVEQQRDRLAREYARALEVLADQRESEGDWAGAVARWRMLASHDPFSSRVAGRLVSALEASGDPGAALRHAEAHELLLRQELGVQPDPAVAALFAQMRASRDAARGATHVQCGPPPAVVRPPAAAPFRSVGAPAVEAASVQNPGPPVEAGRLALAFAKQRSWQVGVSAAVFLVVVLLGFDGLGMADGDHRPGIPIGSLAVMPLADFSSDASEKYFADGMTEALITELARHGGLHVISRHSAMRYKGTDKPVAQIARELGVEALVKGSVVRDRERVRISVQLLRAATDEHLWADSFDRDLRDILSLQREIAETIAREVLAVAYVAARTGNPPVRVDPVAHTLYLRSRYAALTRSRDGLEQGMSYLRRAIALDPGSAFAYAGLADVYLWMADYKYMARPEALDSAEVLVRRALALDSTLSEAHTSLAALLADRGELAGAEAAFRTALDLQPGNAQAHHWYAYYLGHVGRHAEALNVVRRGLALDPLSPQMLATAAMIELVLGDQANALRKLEDVIELEPRAPWSHFVLGLEYLTHGNCELASTRLQQANELASGHPGTKAGVAAYHARCGDRDTARAILRELESLTEASRYALPLAAASTALGDLDQALFWLERADWGSQERLNVQAWSIFSNVRDDPRYALLAPLGAH